MNKIKEKIAEKEKGLSERRSHLLVSTGKDYDRIKKEMEKIEKEIDELKGKI